MTNRVVHPTTKVQPRPADSCNRIVEDKETFSKSSTLPDASCLVLRDSIAIHYKIKTPVVVCFQVTFYLDIELVDAGQWYCIDASCCIVMVAWVDFGIIE